MFFNFFSKHSYKFLIGFIGVLVSFDSVGAINTLLEGWRVDNGIESSIAVYTECKLTTSPSGRDMFVPTKTQGEWDAFKIGSVNNGATLSNCTTDSCLATLPACSGLGNCTLTYAPTSSGQSWVKDALSCGFACTAQYGGSDCSIPTNYIVTYDGNSGTGHSPTIQGVPFNSAIGTFPTNPTRTGYSFSGWYTAPTGGTLVTTSTVITGAVTFYAQWLINSYTVTFDANSGAGHSPTSKSVTYNTAVGTLPTDPARTGYTFNGWWTLASGGVPVTTATVITGTTTIYAHWTINTYTVSGGFGANANGATINVCGINTTANSSGNFSVTRNYGSACNTISATRTGYTCNVVTQGPSSLTANVSNIGGSCTIANYTILFDGNGGSGHTPASKIVTYNTALGALPSDPTMAGWTFVGWYDYSPCTTTCTSGVIANPSQNITTNIVFYAQYTKPVTTFFDGNGGSVPSPSSVTKDMTRYKGVNGTPTLIPGLTVYDTPTRANYTFNGWYTAPTGGTLVPEFNSYSMGSSNTTLYAQWQQIYYNVSFSANGGNGSTTLSIASGNPIGTLPANPTRSGYAFNGWFTATSGGTQITTSTVITAATTFYAQWTANTYTVTLTTNSGVVGTPSVTATYDSSMPAATAPTLVGYTFNGYFTALAGGTKYYNANMTSARSWNIAGATTLYAQGIANTYTVTLDPNTGTPGTTSVTATYGSSMPAYYSAPSKVGNTFNGYFTAPTGGTQYYLANMTSARSWNIVGATTLYAQWTPSVYTVTFNGNNGTGHTPTSKSIPHGSAVGTLPTDPTRTGYTFNGWFTATTGGTSVTTATVITASVTFYAQWTPINYTATFDGNGGVGHSPGTKTIAYNTAVGTLPSSPLRSNYTFNGWYTAPTGGTQVTTTTVILGDVTYYAQWVPVGYTVTFDATGGAGHAPTSKLISYNTAVGTLPTNPTRANYTFNGWFTATSGGTQVTTSTIITAAITFYAQWTPVNYLVQFDGAGYTAPSKLVAYGSAVGDLPTHPTYTGHTLNGWWTLTYGGTQATPSTIITAAIKYYAQFTKNNYTVTFDANGGDGGSMATQSMTYATATALTTNGYTKVGHTFAGWSTTPSGAVAYANNASYTIGAANVTLYAKWTKNNYTVTFSPNGGWFTSGETFSYTVTVPYNTPVGTLPPTNPVNNNNDFSGWWTATSGGSSVTTATVITANTTFYAHWTLSKYTVTFNGNGGTGHSPTSKLVTYGTALGSLPSNPTSVGRTIKYWQIPGGGAATTSKIIYGNETYTAQWFTNTAHVTLSPTTCANKKTGVNQILPIGTQYCVRGDYTDIGNPPNSYPYFTTVQCQDVLGWDWQWARTLPTNDPQYSPEGMSSNNGTHSCP